jgi:hypothetical protein
MAQLHPQALCSLFVSSYDSQLTNSSRWFSLYSLRWDRTENTVSNNSSIVSCLFVSVIFVYLAVTIQRTMQSCHNMYEVYFMLTVCILGYVMLEAISLHERLA